MNSNDKPFIPIRHIIKAFRLPFISASVLFYIFGSLITRTNFNILNFLFGLISVAATHLGANLINDYADSKSGADWEDNKYYGFFGGSKLIQQGIFSEQFYLKSAIFCFALAFTSIISLSLYLKNISVIFYYLIILFLGVAYSYKPFYFVYNKLGELVIFILFGPAIVMGGYFIQTGIFPDFKSFLLSVPAGLLTVAILFGNEIPDYKDDKNAGKVTWVSFLGQERSFILYFAIISFAFIFVVVNIKLGYLNKWAYLSLMLIFPAIKAAKVLKKYYSEKTQLIASSKITIAIHNITSLILIVGVIL